MYTKQLSQFVHSLSCDGLSAQAVEVGKMCVEDLIGVALAGSVQAQGRMWHSYFAAGAQAEEAAAWEPGFPGLACQQAAALNAAYSHLLDMDDVHNASIVHLGTVTIPAALAVGSLLHRSGREVLAAVAAGYEVGARVGEALNPGAYYYWHTTGVVGALATAAAAGKLLRLDEEQYLNAFGSAGTQAAGLWEFLEDGAMSKALHTANATLCGLRSARLAALGLTGASRILEGRRGLLHALAPDSHAERLVCGLGSGPLKLEEISFKPYACCRHTHSAGCAAKRLLDRGGFRPEEIVRITDRTYAVAKQTVDRPEPATAYACKFSAQYCIAAMLLHGNLLDGAFSPDAAAAPGLRSLMKRVVVELDPGLEETHQADPGRWPHVLEITLCTGEVLQERVDYPPGDARNPFDQAALDRKFYAVTSGVLSPAQAEALCGKIHCLDGLADVSLLFA